MCLNLCTYAMSVTPRCYTRHMSNFLGLVLVSHESTSIISTSEILAREGVNLQKGMNYRKNPLAQEGISPLSVFLVLPSHEGVHKDAWNPKTEIYTYEGHDSTTEKSRKRSKDQLLMYTDGKLTDNGKFYKAANEYKDGIRESPLQIQVYEKLDPGVWYDKGVFDLIDARNVSEEGRKIFKFDLQPTNPSRDYVFNERMMSVAAKIEIWQNDRGRCSKCGTEIGLRFNNNTKGGIHLSCPTHRDESRRLLG